MHQSIFLALFTICHLIVSAQTQENPTAIIPRPIQLSDDKTVVLIFPAAVKDVDRGNPSVLAKTVKGTENVLKVKYTTDSAEHSSLHVFTSDQKVYAFTTWFSKDPYHLTWNFRNMETGQDHPAIFSEKRLNDHQLNQIADSLANAPARFHYKSAKRGLAQLYLARPLYDNGIIFLKLKLLNVSPIPFQIDFIHAYIRDNKKTKRTSVMEKELSPLHEKITGDLQAKNFSQDIILAFDQFTIANNRHLNIEVFEKAGDRHLKIKLKGKHLLKSEPLFK